MSGDYPPVSPCGRIVDYVPIAQKVRMRFFADDPTYWHEVQWYYVDPDTAPALPYATPFVSRIWDQLNQEEQPALGELYGTGTYSKGIAPFVCTGRLFCGNEQQWTNGCLTSDPRITVIGGVPTCCKDLVVVAQGGKAKGGSVYVEPGVHVFGGDLRMGTVKTFTPGRTPANLCAHCPGMSYPTYTVTLPAATNGICTDCANVAGSYTVTFTANCTWLGPTIMLCGSAQQLAFHFVSTGPGPFDGQWLVSVGGVLTYRFVNNPLSPWDCLSPLTLTLLTAPGSCTFGSTATVS